MRIIHYLGDINYKSGGTTFYVQYLLNALNKRVKSYLVTHQSKNSIIIDSCTIYYISPHILKMKKEWLHIVQKVRPDVIHINGCWMPQCALIQKWSQQLGYKVLLTTHGMLNPLTIKRNYWTKKLPALLLYQKQAIAKANFLHATSHNEQENLLKLGYNNRIEMVAIGIQVKDIEIKKTWHKTRKIVFLSRIHPQKGVETLIRTVSALTAELKDYQVYIIGEGKTSYINKIHKLISKLNLSDIIHLENGVYGTRKWESLKEADLFVLPTYSESFGIAIAEALACGTPVITTKGAPWEELDTWHCGWWTEIGTEPLRKALLDFLSLSESNLETMGRNGRRLIEEKYSSKKMAEDMFALYKKTTDKDERTN